jgi:hypothetical protein
MYKPTGYKGSWTDKAVRKYIIDIGDWLDMSLALAYADSESSGPAEREKINFDRMKLFEEHIARVKKKPIVKKPLINGDRLMEMFNKPSGAWIKDIINFQMELLYENPEISIENLQNKIKEKYKYE